MGRRKYTPGGLAAVVAANAAAAARRFYGKPSTSTTYKPTSRSGKRPLKGGAPKRPNKMPKRKFKRRGMQVMSSGGSYVGPFQKRTKTGVSDLAYFSKRGFVDTREVNGTISDPDCCYISHSAYSTQILNYIIYALIRKLLDKAGWTVASVDSTIDNLLPTNALNLRFTLVQQSDEDQALTVTNYDTAAGSTVRSMGDAMIGPFQVYSAGVTSLSVTNVLVPMKLQLYQSDNDGVFMFKCELNFTECFVDIFCKSDIKIQNRTLAGNNSADAEDVTSNPLTGRSYLFSGMPKVKTLGLFTQLNTVNSVGVNLVRAAEMLSSTSGVFNSPKEPPLPSLFWNCRKAGKVILNPGNMRSSSISYRSKKIKFLLLLKRMRIQYSVFGDANKQGPYKSNYVLGPVEMFALEDMINIVSANNISLAYEVNRVSAVCVTTRTNRYSDGTFNSGTYSNNAA